MIRVGLVLGGGGVSAQAFHAGLLAALEEVLGFDARKAEIIVGTSAGASTGALIRAGFAGSDLVRRARGEPPSERLSGLLTRLGPPLDIAAFRAAPQPRFGPPASPRTLLTLARHPRQARPALLAAALMPAGQIPSEQVAEPMDRLYGGTWPAHPLWLCAVRLPDGRRTVFGKPGAGTAPVSVGTAVAASCAVPGFYTPVEIGGHRYVDGGVWSATNADVLAGEPLDLVIVSSPMTVTPGLSRPSRDAPLRLTLRRQVNAELNAISKRGTPAILVQPRPEDLRVMGTDLMDPERRAPATAHVLTSMTTRLKDGDLARAFAGLASDLREP
jgi:NTE family protein